MMFNVTDVVGLSSGQLIEMSHKYSAIPSIWISLLSSWVVFLVVGLLTIDSRKGKNPYGKFLLIWVLSVVISGVVGIFLTISPHLISNLMGFLS